MVENNKREVEIVREQHDIDSKGKVADLELLGNIAESIEKNKKALELNEEQHKTRTAEWQMERACTSLQNGPNTHTQ